MFESESNPKVESADQIPPGVLDEFATGHETEAEFVGDYFRFPRHCETALSVRPMQIKYVVRVYGSVQRTNQLYFSSNRYEREDLASLLDDSYRTAPVVDGRDRFGDYGTVGFCMIDESTRTMMYMLYNLCELAGFTTAALRGYELQVSDAVVEYLRSDQLVD